MGYSDAVQKYVAVWVFHKVCNSYVSCGAEVKSKSLSFYGYLSTLLHGPWSSCLEKGVDKTEQSLSSILEFQASLESKDWRHCFQYGIGQNPVVWQWRESKSKFLKWHWRLGTKVLLKSTSAAHEQLPENQRTKGFEWFNFWKWVLFFWKLLWKHTLHI